MREKYRQVADIIHHAQYTGDELLLIAVSASTAAQKETNSEKREWLEATSRAAFTAIKMGDFLKCGEN